MNLAIRRDRETTPRYLDLGRITPELSAAFESAGISQAELTNLAGADGVISGRDEVAGLFARVDRVAESGRSADIARAQGLRTMIDREISASGPPALELDGAAVRDRARPGIGARSTYRSAEVPGVRSTEPPPEQPCLFIRILETLFGWLPGVSTDDDRLRDYGRRLADEHGSDIMAAQAAWEREQSSRPRNAIGVATGGGTFRDALVSDLAGRMQREQGLDADTARARAGVAVDAMLARHEQNQTAAEGRVSDIPMRDPAAPWAASLARVAVPVRDSARAMGATWEARYDRAMSAVPADYPGMQYLPAAERPRQLDMITVDRLYAVSTVMAMERSGQLTNVPPAVVDRMLDLHHRGVISRDAMADTLSELQRMPQSERRALLQRLDSVPEDRRDYAYAVLAREHYGIGANDASERAGALTAVRNAATQLRSMSADDAAAAFRRGTLGLDGPTSVRIDYERGGRRESLDVPVYFHPGVSAEDRARQTELIREAYSHVPPAVMRRMLEGEGGEPFAVQVLPQSSIETDEISQARPDGEAPEGGHYRPEFNHLRINATELSRIMAEDRGRAVGIILHETSHGLDDLGNTSQGEGMFLTRSRDVAASQPLVTGAGELAPAYAHFTAMRSRYTEMREDMSDPDARGARLYRNTSVPGDRERHERALDRMAGRSGGVTGYGVLGGDESPRRNPALQLGEWWAETYSHYLNPATSDRLRAADPVAYAAAERYTQLVESGVPPPEAQRQALRFSLSTEVAAQQGTAIVRGAGPLTTAQLADVEGITAAFDLHQRALNGWEPFAGDAGLRRMRGEEAQRGAAEGRTLLTAIDERLARATPGSEEHRRLTASRTRLRAAVEQLERRAESLLR